MVKNYRSAFYPAYRILIRLAQEKKKKSPSDNSLATQAEGETDQANVNRHSDYAIGKSEEQK